MSLYSATRVTLATQQTFLQVRTHNIIICLTNTPPCKVEYDQIDIVTSIYQQHAVKM